MKTFLFAFLVASNLATGLLFGTAAVLLERQKDETSQALDLVERAIAQRNRCMGIEP